MTTTPAPDLAAELAMSAWFRGVGTKLSKEDYEAGIETLHATLTRLHTAEATIQRVREIHEPFQPREGDPKFCEECSVGQLFEMHPCPTILALEGE